MLEIKNTVIDMNDFDGFICRLDRADEKMFGLEDISQDTSQSISKDKKKSQR